MKKLLSLLLAVMMLSAIMVAAQADVAAGDSVELNWYDLSLNRYSNMFYGREVNKGQSFILDRFGNVISNGYDEILSRDRYFRVETNNGSINCYGMVNDKGEEIVPCQYGDVKYVSDRWALAMVLESATEENYDYKTYTTPKSFYLISGIDVYYMGSLVGSIGRTEYDYATGRGAFISIKAKDGTYAQYDSAFNKSAYATKYGSEYEYNYSTKQVWHAASNQQAFCPGCTLTADDVSQSWYEIGSTFYDLQGNALFTHKYSYVSPYNSEYARAKKDNLYGIISMKDGTEIVPCEYDEINYSYYGGDFISVVKDGKYGFVDMTTGRPAYMSDYPDSAVNDYGMMGRLKDLTGEFIIVTPYGEISQRFTDVSLNYSQAECFIGKTADGEAVYDMHGNVLASGAKYYSLSQDGTLLLGTKGSRKGYVITQVVKADNAPVKGITKGDDDDDDDDDVTPETTPAPAAYDWSCPGCGTGNNGKFCSECGFARPTPEPTPSPTPTPTPTPTPEPTPEPTDWTCPNCSNHNTGKFCPECGSPRPTPEPADWTCSCGAVNTGKFCPECGSPRP